MPRPSRAPVETPPRASTSEWHLLERASARAARRPSAFCSHATGPGSGDGRNGRLPRWVRGAVDQDSLHRRLPEFEPEHAGALRAYLRRAVVNRIRDEMRRAAFRLSAIAPVRLTDAATASLNACPARRGPQGGAAGWCAGSLDGASSSLRPYRDGGSACVGMRGQPVSPPSPLPGTGTGGGSGSTRRREAAQRCRPPPGSGGLSTPMSRRARSKMRSSRAWIRGAPADGGSGVAATGGASARSPTSARRVGPPRVPAPGSSWRFSDEGAPRNGRLGRVGRRRAQMSGG